MTWNLILDDKSQHEITVQISYKVGSGKELKSGVIDGDPEALLEAFNNTAVSLLSPSGTEHPVHVMMQAGEWRVVPR